MRENTTPTTTEPTTSSLIHMEHTVSWDRLAKDAGRSIALRYTVDPSGLTKADLYDLAFGLSAFSTRVNQLLKGNKNVENEKSFTERCHALNRAGVFDAKLLISRTRSPRAPIETPAAVYARLSAEGKTDMEILEYFKSCATR